jgi:hypothetical protein
MLQIYRKENSSLWEDMKIKKNALKAAIQVGPPGDVGALVRTSSTRSHLDASEHSVGDISLFGDAGWGSKMSYSRIRNVLSALRNNGETRKGDKRKSALSFKSIMGSSMRRFSVLSNGEAGNKALNRQNSLCSAGDDTEKVDAPKVSLFTCCITKKAKTRFGPSKLNTVLGKYDDSNFDNNAEESINHGEEGRLYPASAPRRKSRISFALPEDGAKKGTYNVGRFNGVEKSSLASRSDVGSAVGTLGTNTMQHPGPVNSRFPGNLIGDDGDSVSLQSSLGEKVGGKVLFSPSKGNQVVPITGMSPGAEGVAKRKVRHSKMSSGEDDSRMSGGYGENDFELKEDEEEDNRSVVSKSVHSLMRSFSGFSLLSGGGGGSGHTGLAHGKHCMCGCRAY